MEDEEFTDSQGNSRENSLNAIRPFQWKKGQSGNPKGRTKGKTMKEYAKELLAHQTEEERQEFLHGLPKDIIWKMAEGNPDNKQEIKHDLGTQFTPEEIEAAKQIIVKRLNDKSSQETV